MSKIHCLLGLTVALVATPALSQVPRVVAPVAPSNLAPNSLLQRASHNMPITVNADLQWTGPIAGSVLQPLPSFFAICVYPAATPFTCTWLNKTWSAAVDGGNGLSPPTTVYSAPQPFRPPFPIALRYTFRPPSGLPAGLLNQPLKWVVGACITNSLILGGMQCSFSGARDLHFTSIDLVATNADMRGTTPSELSVVVRATNPGLMDSPAGPFKIRVDIWEAVTTRDPVNNAPLCERNFNAPAVRANPGNHLVVFGRSPPMPAADLQNGAAHDPADIIAVVRRGPSGGTLRSFEEEYRDIPLQPGITSARAVLEVRVPLMTTGRGFVAAAEFDWNRSVSPLGEIVEHNETNNRAVRCRAPL